MSSLPLLIEQDVAAINAALADFVAASSSRLALLIDIGGFIIASNGEHGEMDLTTLGALAANSFAATQAIANIIEDQAVTSLYQEGVTNSLLILAVADFGFLAAVFPSEIGVGSVKYTSRDAISRLSRQLADAQSRAPAESLDLASLNLADAAPLFRRRAAT